MKLSKLYIIAAAFLLVGIIVFTVGFAMLGFDFPILIPSRFTPRLNTPQTAALPALLLRMMAPIFVLSNRATRKFILNTMKTASAHMKSPITMEF